MKIKLLSNKNVINMQQSAPSSQKDIAYGATPLPSWSISSQDNIQIATKKSQIAHLGHAKRMVEGRYNFITNEGSYFNDRFECIHTGQRIEIKNMTGPIILELPSAEFADGKRIFETSILFIETSAFDVVLKFTGKMHVPVFYKQKLTAGELILPSGMSEGALISIHSDTDFNYYVRSQSHY